MSLCNQHGFKQVLLTVLYIGREKEKDRVRERKTHRERYMQSERKRDLERKERGESEKKARERIKSTNVPI